MDIFEKRTAFKPFEYPELVKFKEAIQQSYWLVSEWNFISDIQDFNTALTDKEKSVVRNALLAISQIEVSVKRFWVDLGKRFPKPEIDQVGVVFGDSEVRHADSYSHLLEVLSLNDAFAQLLNVKQIANRVDYLTKYLKGASENSNENYTLTLVLFSIFIENVSLFSQFLIIKAFFKFKNVLKDTENVVQATQKEEQVHALFGIKLIEIIKKENPKWFNEDFYLKLERACKKAYIAEEGIVDWIFEDGDLDFISRVEVKEFVKDRFNKSLQMVGGTSIFDIDNSLLDKCKWFNEDIDGEVSIDFFHKKPVTYSKRGKSVTEGDLF